MTKERLHLCAWMRRNNAASLAELYEGAVRLLVEAKLPGRVRLISHAVREIRNRLPDVISGTRSTARLDYKSRLDRINKKWQRSGLRLDASLPEGGFEADPGAPRSPNIEVAREVFAEIAGLVKDHEETRTKPLDTAIRLFEACAPENQRIRDTLRPIILQWLRVTDWFMSKAHDSGYVDGDIDETELISQFELFETYLNAMVRGFFTTLDELDAILEDTNSCAGFESFSVARSC
jgi:hypothetical protein